MSEVNWTPLSIVITWGTPCLEKTLIKI